MTKKTAKAVAGEFIRDELTRGRSVRIPLLFATLLEHGYAVTEIVDPAREQMEPSDG